MPRKPKPMKDRFWPRVDKSAGPDACWPWTGSRLIAGYGKLTDENNKQVLAHRVSFFFTNGYFPSVVMHSCDNPPCCNPHHLVGATQSLNLRDMYNKGRGPSNYKKPRFTGSKNLQSKLNEQLVKEILDSSLSQRKLAKKYNVSRRCITFIQNGTTWKHVTRS